MSDLIDRQAAIDALEKEQSLVERPITETRWFDLGLRKARDVLCELPSVQPEVLAHGEGELSAQPERWIPCSEKLPESNQCVLVSIKGEVDVDWIAVDSTGYGCWHRCMKDVMSADAWMPLPEPYKGEQE